MPHPTHIDGLTPKELAKLVSNLRFDALQKFLEELSVELQNQVFEDVRRGRHALAGELNIAAQKIVMAALSVEDAWLISKPYMVNEPQPPVMSEEEAKGMLKRLATYGFTTSD